MTNTKDLIRGFENAIQLSDQLIAVLGEKLTESKQGKSDPSPNDFKWELPPLVESNLQIDPDFEKLLGIKHKVETRDPVYSNFDKVKADSKYMIESIKAGKADPAECEQILVMIVESLDKAVETVLSEETDFVALAKEKIAANDPMIHDVASETGQDADNVKHMGWFVNAVADRLKSDADSMEKDDDGEPVEKEKFAIYDWAGNEMFDGQEFDSFDDAEEFLSTHLGDGYEEDRQEYEILPVPVVGDKSRDSRYLDPNDPRAGQRKRNTDIDEAGKGYFEKSPYALTVFSDNAIKRYEHDSGKSLHAVRDQIAKDFAAYMEKEVKKNPKFKKDLDQFDMRLAIDDEADDFLDVWLKKNPQESVGESGEAATDPKFKGKQMDPQKKKEMGTSLAGKFVRSGDTDSAKKILKAQPFESVMDKIEAHEALLNETGEMSQDDLEPGGEWHEVRQKMDQVIKDAGVKGVVKPFDQYQGPRADLPDYSAWIWLNNAEGGAYPESVGEGEFTLEYKGELFNFDTGEELKDLLVRVQTPTGDKQPWEESVDESEIAPILASLQSESIAPRKWVQKIIKTVKGEDKTSIVNKLWENLSAEKKKQVFEANWEPDAEDLYDYAQNVEYLYNMVNGIESEHKALQAAEQIIADYNEANKEFPQRQYRGSAEDVAAEIMKWEATEESVTEDQAEAMPRAWFERISKQLKSQDPKYSDDLVKSHIEKIWRVHFSDDKRKEIIAKESKTHAERTCTANGPESMRNEASPKKKPSIDQAKMKEIAEKSGLDWDGGDDNRLFKQETLTVFIHLMSEEQWDKMNQDLQDYEVEGPGFKVYAWNDGSSYEYWKKEGEADNPNYIQITAAISDPSQVDPMALAKAIDEADAHFAQYENVDQFVPSSERENDETDEAKDNANLGMSNADKGGEPPMYKPGEQRAQHQDSGKEGKLSEDSMWPEGEQRALIQGQDKTEGKEVDEDKIASYLEQWKTDEQYSDFDLALERGFIRYAASLIVGGGAIDPDNADGAYKKLEGQIQDWVSSKNYPHEEQMKDIHELLKNCEVWVSPDTNEHFFLPMDELPYGAETQEGVKEHFKADFSSGYDEEGNEYSESKLPVKEQEESLSVEVNGKKFGYTEDFKSGINEKELEEKTASSTIKKYEALKNKKVWGKQEILGVAHRLSDIDRGWKQDMDEELKYILHELLSMFQEGHTVDISPEQSQQGIDWLKRNIINAKGMLRDTGMVRDAGFTQEDAEIIKNFKKFELVGFKNDEQHHIYAPIYRTYAQNGEYFDYSVSGGFGGAAIDIHR